MCLLMSSCTPSNEDNIALGSLERERILLTATDNQLITNILVKEGDVVKSGDLLVQLDDTIAKAKVQEATAKLNEATAIFTKLKNGARKEDIAAAKARLTSAKAELAYQNKTLERELALVQDGVQPKSELDKAQAKFDSAQAQHQDAYEQLLKLTNGARKEDLAEAQAKVSATNASLQISIQKANELNIIATRDGVVEALPWNIGERVSVGSPTAILLSDGPPFARIYIPETYRTELHSGDKVSVSIDGAKTEVGIIDKIATQPSFTPYYGLSETDRSRLVYLAEIKLPSASSNLPSGVPVEVNL